MTPRAAVLLVTNERESQRTQHGANLMEASSDQSNDCMPLAGGRRRGGDRFNHQRGWIATGTHHSRHRTIAAQVGVMLTDECTTIYL